MAETRTRRTSRSKSYPTRGEIYLTALDPALGHEIKKTRPTLIIQNDISNQYGQTTIVAAITSKVNTPLG
jgi:mRNA interferase MazF